MINVTGLFEPTKPGSVWEKFELHLTSTCLLELLAAEYLRETNISSFISHLWCLEKVFEKGKRRKKEIVEVLQQTSYRRKRSR